MKKLVDLINTNCAGTLTEENLKIYLNVLGLKIVDENAPTNTTSNIRDGSSHLDVLYIKAKDALKHSMYFNEELPSPDTINIAKSNVDNIYTYALSKNPDFVSRSITSTMNLRGIKMPEECLDFFTKATQYASEK